MLLFEFGGGSLPFFIILKAITIRHGRTGYHMKPCAQFVQFFYHALEHGRQMQYFLYIKF